MTIKNKGAYEMARKTIDNVKNPVLSGQHIITFIFGYYERNKVKYLHKGLDLVSGKRSDVLALADGTVVSFCNTVKGTNKNTGTLGMGNYVILLHEGKDGTKWRSRYQHMETGSVVVKKNQKVKAGQKLGIIGNTGYSTGRHLHFDVSCYKKVDGSIKSSSYWYVNPLPYITGEKTFNDGVKTETKKETPKNKTYQVTAGALNIRKGPGTNYGKAGLLFKGKTFKSDTVKGDWVLYQTGKWVSKNHLKEMK